MSYTLKTSWNLIQGASAGELEAREEFARRYAPVARAYLIARWSGFPLQADIEDAVQEVFVESFKTGGILGRADRDRGGGFRAFFFGTIKNVALRFEKRGGKQAAKAGGGPSKLERMPDPGDTPSLVFDRAWARAMMREAAALQQARGREQGGDAARRVDLLRLRFYEGMPIREIAELWETDATILHREYARARREFEDCLKEVLALEHPGRNRNLDKLMADLMAVLK